jgi:hypothetical protein
MGSTFIVQSITSMGSTFIVQSITGMGQYVHSAVYHQYLWSAAKGSPTCYLRRSTHGGRGVGGRAP